MKLLEVRYSTGFFEASCIVCGHYKPVYAFESYMDGVTRCEDRFCEEHQDLAGNEYPINRTCECCGKERNVREERGCSNCGCSDLKRPLKLTQADPAIEIEWESRWQAILHCKEIPEKTEFDSEGKIRSK